ncbi:MAG: hypothetical protein KatS3mg010_1883 [Acidimicrobiia bacterium]|nr:MAG: hypothetical protein KatS3mg010_1883 [Acidimicrobiia bacterium]
MVGTNFGAKRLPPVPSKMCGRTGSICVATWSAIGSRHGWSNRATLTAAYSVNGTTTATRSAGAYAEPSALVGSPSHRAGRAIAGRRDARAARTRRRPARTSARATTGPRPTELRVSSASPVATPVRVSVRADGRARNPSSAANAATAHAAPHSSASWYTTGRLARKHTTDPDPTRNVNPPARAASNRPTRVPARASSRTRHARRTVATISTANATSIEICVSRPSKRSVSAATGMRSSVGHGPK